MPYLHRRISSPDLRMQLKWQISKRGCEICRSFQASENFELTNGNDVISVAVDCALFFFLQEQIFFNKSGAEFAEALESRFANPDRRMVIEDWPLLILYATVWPPFCTPLCKCVCSVSFRFFIFFYVARVCNACVLVQTSCEFAHVFS